MDLWGWELPCRCSKFIAERRPSHQMLRDDVGFDSWVTLVPWGNKVWPLPTFAISSPFVLSDSGGGGARRMRSWR